MIEPSLLGWVAGKLLAGSVGVVLGIFLRELLPEKIESKITYTASRFKKWFKNENYAIHLYTEFRVGEPVEKADLMEVLQKSFGVQPDAHDTIHFTKTDTDDQIEVEIRPKSVQDVGMFGDVSIEDTKVEKLVTQIDATPRYRELTTVLLAIQDVEKELIEAISSAGLSREETQITCEVSAEPTLKRYLSEGHISTLRGESDDGTKINISDDTIQINASSASTATAYVKRAIINYS